MKPIQCGVVLAAAAIASAVGSFAADVPSAKPAVTISPETTYITRPLGPDGYVDYVAALNEMSSRGVTPEENFAVLFWQAVGPWQIDREFRDEYFRNLGCPMPAAEGNYFLPIKDFAEAGAELAKLTGRAARTWTRQEFLALADWLTKNEPPLKRVIDASHRPRRYDPLYSDVDGTMIGIQLPGTVMLRQVAQALTARATLRIAEDDFDGTWADLLACHRLARLTGQGPNLVDALTGTGLESAACQGDQLLLANLHIDAKQAARMQKGLGELLPLPKMADTIDVEARFTFLDSAMTVLRDIRKHPQAKPTFLGRFLPGGGDADWDLVLRMGRSWYDRMVDAVHRPTRAERQRALRTIEADFDAFIAGLKNQGDLSKILNGRTLRSQAIFGVVYAMLAPNARICSDGDDRAAMVLELTKVACALIGYRADHGSYPNQLAELSPKYIVEIPLDVFSGKPLRYVRYGNDMLLYSVGVNERDDGGRDYNDWLGAPEDVILLPCDDLVVRLPVAFQYSEQ